jgi:hypothetical protein
VDALLDAHVGVAEMHEVGLADDPYQRARCVEDWAPDDASGDRARPIRLSSANAGLVACSSTARRTPSR